MEQKIIKKEREWYDNPNVLTTTAIVILTLSIILSQSYAVKNNLTTNEILRNLLNHNTLYIIGLTYFVPLKTKKGKKYFNYLNVFLIVIYAIFTSTSLLSVIRSFGIASLVTLGVNIIFLIYMIHVFLKKTRFWKEFKLEKSPFNEIKNENFYYAEVIFAIILLAVNLVYSTNFDGVVLSIVGMTYNIVLARYIYNYQIYLEKDSEEKKRNSRDLFYEIDQINKDLPKLKTIAKDVASQELNGYQVISLVIMGICLLIGIIFGNLFPSCGSTSGMFNKTCVITEFNFSLTICIWLIGFLIGLFFYAMGHIISVLESINNNLKKK